MASDQILNPMGMLSVLQLNKNSIIFAVTIVIHKSCNLIGTQASSWFGPKCSLRRLVLAIARARIGTHMKPKMRVIHRTHESDVVSDVFQLLLAFLEFSVCRNIRNEMFHHDLLSFAIAIAVIYFLVAPVICS